MKRLILGITLLLLLSNLSPLQATAFERVFCPPGTGSFTMTNAGLAVTVVKEDGKPVTPYTELLANPVTGKDADAVTGCGLFVFNSHVDKETGRVFVHWETLKPAK
jgi:hypothetical protein